MADADSCGSVQRGADPWLHLRIGAIFVILVTSLFGTLAPIIAKRSWRVPPPAFDFVKYFGSGVIIATAFIHLLSPAYEELGSPCLSEVWASYPFAAAFAMASMFGIFFVELFAFRIGSRLIIKTGLSYDVHAGPTSHTHHETGNAMHSTTTPMSPSGKEIDLEAAIDNPSRPVASPSDSIPVTRNTSTSPPSAPTKTKTHSQHGHGHGQSFLSVGHSHDAETKEHDEDVEGEGLETDPRLIVAQLVGVAILEFGIVLHSIIIGLTLAVDDAFRTLFVVLIFHQMFEGLGLGSRLAFLSLPPRYTWVPYLASIFYSCMTPLGIAIGLGVRTTYNPDSTTASIVSGTLDALSAGVLLYTGLVELLAHEFLFNPKMHEASTGKIVYACSCIMVGAAIMALLGKWA